MVWDVTKVDGVDVLAADDYNTLVTNVKAKVDHSLATAQNDFLVASGVGAFVKKTLAEVKAILGLGGAAYLNVGTGAGTVAAGDDSRLSDARTPSSHTHGNVTNAGAIGSTSGLPVITTTAGVLTAGAFGTGAGEFCQGNDSRLNGVSNLVINGGFSVAQRGTTFTSTSNPANSDDTYLLDQWILLSDGNDIVDVSQDTLQFSRSLYALKAEVETANKKFGFLNIVEANTCIPLRGQTISMSFAAKTATSKVINNIRVAVLEWTGTADSVTSDAVSAWGAQGTTPTWATSWAALNTPANLGLTTSEQTFKVENLTVGASCNNLAVFIWVDDTDAAVDDLLYLGEVQIVRGSVATSFIPDHFNDELSDCIRFFQKSYDYAHTIGASIGDYVGYNWLQAITTNIDLRHYVKFAHPMRAIPTILIYDHLGGVSKFNIPFGTSGTAKSAGAANASNAGFTAYPTESLTAGQIYGFYWVASAEL